MDTIAARIGAGHSMLCPYGRIAKAEMAHQKSAGGDALRLRSGQVGASRVRRWAKKIEGANALRRLRPLNRAVNFRLHAPRIRLAPPTLRRAGTEPRARSSTGPHNLPAAALRQKGSAASFPTEARSLRAFRSSRRRESREASACVVAEPPSLRNLFIRFSAARAVRPVRLRTGPLSPGASRANLASQAPCGACDF